MEDEPGLVTDTARVSEIASAIRRAGVMAFDLEFVSEGRYVPDLSLVQVGWGDPDAPEVAAIDCTAADPRPILALVAADDVETISHSARQDLGLLATRFGVEARALWDTQIAAAFAGMGDQIGYGRLVEQLVGAAIDKGQQFTAWLDRPLTGEQLRYALDDVRYLLRAWQLLRARLDVLGRLSWVREESLRLAQSSLAVGPPETAYRDVKGWKALRGSQLSALAALAAWRRREAVARNKPPSWILPDHAMVELARGEHATPRDLRGVRGIGDGTVRRYGKQILSALEARRREPPAAHVAPAARISQRVEIWGGVVASLVKARCAAAKLAPRFVGTRGDAEDLARWFEGGCAGPAPCLATGWRHEFVGADALAWLRGEAALRAGAPPGAAVDLDRDVLDIRDARDARDAERERRPARRRSPSHG